MSARVCTKPRVSRVLRGGSFIDNGYSSKARAKHLRQRQGPEEFDKGGSSSG